MRCLSCSTKVARMFSLAIELTACSSLFPLTVGERVRVRGMGFQSPDDFSQDAVDISQHVVIPEAQFQSVQTPVTQTKPQDSFCVGLLTPQTSCCINTPRHNPSPALASLGHPLPLGEGRRPQAQQVADREYEISTIHRVEMERGDAAVDEVENLLGSNRRGD